MNPAAPSVLPLLAELVSYPSPDLAATAESVRARMAGHGCPAEPLLATFLAGVAPLDLGAQEELFTRTFDMNPQLCLDLGWHLHGENYDRGAFLVTMRDALRRHGIEEGPELPDHLSYALRLLAHLEGIEARAFAEGVLVPALDHILAAFEETDNPYRKLLEAVRHAAGRSTAPVECES